MPESSFIGGPNGGTPFATGGSGGVFSIATSNVTAYGAAALTSSAALEQLARQSEAIIAKMREYQAESDRLSEKRHAEEEAYRQQIQALDAVESKMREIHTEGISTLETLNEVGAAGTACVQKLYEIQKTVEETHRVSTDKLDAIERLIEERMPRARLWLSKLVQDCADGKFGIDELFSKLQEFLGNSGFQYLSGATSGFYGDLQGLIRELLKLQQVMKDTDAAATTVAGSGGSHA